jgi:hypothetical protein
MSRSKKIAFIIFIYSMPKLALAEPKGFEISDFPYTDRNLIESVGMILHSSAIEGANSHGQIGGSLGVGLRQPRFPEHSTNLDSDPGTTAVQLHVVKGLDAPIDFGFSFSNVQGTSGTALTGYLQWTIFEDFRLPSAALRVGYGSTFGYEFMDVGSSSADMLVSYEIVQFLGIYAGVGMSMTRANYDLEKSTSGLSLARTSGKLVNTESGYSIWQSRQHSFGISIRPLPPFFSINGEVTRNDRGIESISAKLAIGM